MLRKKETSQYIVLTDQHMYIADSLKEIEKESSLMLSEGEFKRIDGNYIVNLNNRDIDFIIDKKRMSNIPWQSLIKKDMTLNYLMYGMLALQVINFLKG